MADNGFKINKSINLNPQAGAPANPVDGDFYYDSTAQSFAYYHNGSWANFDSVGSVSAALWLTSAQFTPDIVRNSVIKVTGGIVTSHLAGISSSFSAKRITVYNDGVATIVVEPQDTNEPTSNNRIVTPTGGSMNLVAGEVAVFTYDIAANRWLLVSISSNAGAQLIATTTNPGLVTLHQASLYPLDGVVLSDGDLNAPNGVVGLNANRAASIAAPLAAVTALTVTANGTSNAVDLYGHLAMKTNTSYIKLYGGGLIAGINGFIQLTTPGTGLGAGTLSNFTDGSGGAGFNMSVLRIEEGASGGTLEIAVHETRNTISDPTNGAPIDIGPSEDWRFNSDGSFSKRNTAAQIHNVADPTAAQDVATMQWAGDRLGYRNLCINGNMRIWQRGTSAITLTKNTIGYSARQYLADRFYGFVRLDSAGSISMTYERVNTFLTNTDYASRIKFTATTGGGGFICLAQDIDREFVKLIRGKKVTLSFKWAKGSTMGDRGLIEFMYSTGDWFKNITNYSGAAILSTEFVSNANIPSSLGASRTHVTSAVVPTNATTLAFYIGMEVSGTYDPDPDNYLDITDVVLTVGDNANQAPYYQYPYAGGDFAGEVDLCQRYYETSADMFGNPPGTTGAAYGTTTLAYDWNTLAGAEKRYAIFNFQTRKHISPDALGLTYQTGGHGQGYSSWVGTTTSSVYDEYAGSTLTVDATYSTCSEKQMMLSATSPGALAHPTNHLIVAVWAVDVDF
jgi:hypothetical protein